ncbi:bifunctional 4-hydroxy-2-oxoglutarate aldolase/2-dehydro-3-deoxy-phosphogluconate aldolase [Halobacillus sp. A5]|uniref:bifunctional 4-hydroxy-2-oxoglutarate aldolase/2-dehydro-3-deoxy-phosphogluconate aldolase n=1 Tax=Halobacillus sp. A5 TaxID=2880263 RepID=UPI0020A684F4|nr:bifunctional 4-hydroxy-2-oxoglutarate aldolase/2-dehydro-3-deoxy-phosphogluconate aldolase [Halobacillus sp. A5]MCP3027367.1 bifunctional 4-hydroxy-2-oxoglutarate aldolase/2-dehydro-3-deoxy-phosphogluconate aldolase [Halobacillus sp. A5]
MNQILQQAKVIPVVRKANVDNILPIAEALETGGINVIEITAETPDVEELIKQVRNSSLDILVGAGTVLDAETAKAVIAAGAQFIVSPTLNKEAIRLANRYGIPFISGALTPTEVLTAYEAGAAMVKIFPAGSMGPDYIKNIRGPLPHIPIMATGGIHLENMNEYFQAGAGAVGVGSQLVSADQLTSGEDYRRLTTEAERYIRKAQ